MLKDFNNEEFLMCILAFILGFLASKMMKGNLLTESFMLGSDDDDFNIRDTPGCGKCVGACRCGNNDNPGCERCLAGKSGCNFY